LKGIGLKAKNGAKDGNRTIRRMQMTQRLTAIIEHEGSGYVSLCPELDIASQGDTIEDARDNLKEALELFFETVSPEEIKERLHGDVFVTQVEVAVG
jgi:predicted RNase H-like HicB family nuclease